MSSDSGTRDRGGGLAKEVRGFAVHTEFQNDERTKSVPAFDHH